ncbi:MAG: site-specific integrase [Gammaproteobacteria bacterium]|nr:site-specific integrase [Gammaproteobacteria bacterium]MCF6260180.1 site-specific integrase [Gammaproteobacteria bacterium]
MANRRPIKRLLGEYEPGSGKAQIVNTPSQLSHILFVASRGELGRRNVSILWMLFGTGLRINEVAQLKVSDAYYPSGELKTAFIIPGTYTKMGKPRPAYIKVKQQREALGLWQQQRVAEGAMLSEDGLYGGLLDGGSPLFLSKKGVWRKFAFNTKKYKTIGGIKETMVCASLENTVRDIIKSAGVQGGSSHSGRRSIATKMDRKGYDLKLIQKILGHEDEEMTLEYVDPDMDRIDAAYKNLWKGVNLPNFNNGNTLNVKS